MPVSSNPEILKTAKYELYYNARYPLPSQRGEGVEQKPSDVGSKYWILSPDSVSDISVLNLNRDLDVFFLVYYVANLMRSMM